MSKKNKKRRNFNAANNSSNTSFAKKTAPASQEAVAPASVPPAEAAPPDGIGEAERALIDSGKQWEIRELLSSQLEIAPDYQRVLEMSRVKQIVANFDSDLVNVLKVSYRDGVFHVFDGAHTLAALRMINPDKDFAVTCKVFFGLSYQEEARLFAQQNGLAKKVGIPYKLRALEIAGDGETLKFLSCTRLITPGEEGRQKKNRIVAVAQAFNSYRVLGAEMYSRMLTLLMKTWQGDPKSVSQNILSGMTLVMKLYGDKLKDSRFIRRLKGESYENIRREAQKIDGVSASCAYAWAIVKLYNRSGGIGTLDPNRVTVGGWAPNGDE